MKQSFLTQGKMLTIELLYLPNKQNVSKRLLNLWFKFSDGYYTTYTTVQATSVVSHQNNKDGMQNIKPHIGREK